MGVNVPCSIFSCRRTGRSAARGTGRDGGGVVALGETPPLSSSRESAALSRCWGRARSLLCCHGAQIPGEGKDALSPSPRNRPRHRQCAPTVHVLMDDNHFVPWRSQFAASATWPEIATGLSRRRRRKTGQAGVDIGE